MGEMFVPHGASARPSILVIGGSEGGVLGSAPVAAAIAMAGFPAFAVAYFGEPGLPEQLQEIPLETFGRAIAWLSQQVFTDPGRIGVVGGSKGGEAALLVASNYPEVRAVVAHATTHVSWQSINRRSWARASSWTFEGRPLQFVRYRGWFNPFAGLTGYYGQSLAAAANIDDCAIAVEKTNGAILLVSGGQDRMWRSAAMGQTIVDRLQRLGFSHPVEHWVYPDAGHLAFGPPLPDGHPAMKMLGRQGGSVEANAAAREDSWPKFLKFIEANLCAPSGAREG